MVGYFTAALAGSACLGALVMVIITAQPDDRGVVDPTAFRAHLVIERLSPLWLVAALTMVVVQAAVDSGVAAARLLVSGRLPDALGASESARAWVVVTVCAAVLAITSRLVLRWEWHLPLMIPAVVGIVAVPVSGDAGQGPDHDYATSSVIVFALAIAIWAGIKIVGPLLSRVRGTPSRPDRRGRRRGDRTGLRDPAAVAAGRYRRPDRIRLRNPRSAGRRCAAGRDSESRICAARGQYVERAGRCHRGDGHAGGTVGDDDPDLPWLLDGKPTIWDVLLGYELPGAPTALRLSTSGDSTPSSVLQRCYSPAFTCTGCCACAAGMHWPLGRTVAWVAGCSALLLATGRASALRVGDVQRAHGRAHDP